MRETFFVQDSCPHAQRLLLFPSPGRLHGYQEPNQVREFSKPNNNFKNVDFKSLSFNHCSSIGHTCLCLPVPASASGQCLERLLPVVFAFCSLTTCHPPVLQLRRGTEPPAGLFHSAALIHPAEEVWERGRGGGQPSLHPLLAAGGSLWPGTGATLTLRVKWINLRAPWVSSALLFIGGVHIGARALHGLNLIWFGNITRLSQWGGGGYFLCSNDFYLPSLCVEEGGGGSAPCALTTLM